MNILKKVLQVALVAFLSVILLCNLYALIAGMRNPGKMPMVFGYGMSVVLSGSMEPALQVNDLVVIRQTDSVQIGDIIVYQSGDMLIIHRVLSMNGDQIVTKGDANNAADDPISMDAVRGIMTMRIPGVGALIQFVRRPVVVGMLMLLALLLAEMGYREEKQKEQDELAEMENEIRRLKDMLEKDRD